MFKKLSSLCTLPLCWQCLSAHAHAHSHVAGRTFTSWLSPHGQDAESNEWLEEAHEPGQEGFLYVKKVWAKASVIKDSLTQVSSILEKDCIHKEMYDTIALSMQQIMEVVQTTIAMSELDEFTVLH